MCYIFLDATVSFDINCVTVYHTYLTGSLACASRMHMYVHMYIYSFINLFIYLYIYIYIYHTEHSGRLLQDAEPAVGRRPEGVQEHQAIVLRT